MAAEPKKPAAPKKNPFIDPKKANAQKKPAAPKKDPVPKVEAPAPKLVQMDLYTIRLQPELITKLKAVADKKGVTHAQVARDAVAQYLATVK